METFPSDFPMPQTSLAGDAQPNSIRTQMDSGTVRQRRRFTAEKVFVNVSWELSDNEFGVFVAYHLYKLNLGNDWFNMSLPLGGGINNHVVRFVDGRFSQQYVTVGFWRVSAVLEIQERAVFSEDVLEFYLDNGFSDEAIENLLFDVNAFHQCVHETLPTNLN